MKMLFRGDGGEMHRWFVKWVKFSVINYFLVYWATDFMIVTGTLDSASNASTMDWYTFFSLFGIQIYTIWLASNFQSSIDFDYKLAAAEPSAFRQSTYGGANEFQTTEFVDSADVAAPSAPQKTGGSNYESTADIETYWGF